MADADLNPDDIIVGMVVLADSMIAVFDSDTNLDDRRLEKGDRYLHARERPYQSTFDRISENEWRVGFDSDQDIAMTSAIRVFTGVFQSVLGIPRSTAADDTCVWRARRRISANSTRLNLKR